MVDRKILLDVETTGLSHDKNDRIIEIACVEILDDRHMKEEIHFYINPQRDIPEEAVNIHGISNEMVKDSPMFSAIANDLINFIGDSKIIAHNSRFDMGFVNSELKRIEMDAYPEERFVDTLKIAQQKFPGQKNRLDDLCKRYNISLQSRKDFHGALVDTKLLGEVYIRLLGGQKNIFENSISEENLFDGTLLSYENSNFQYRKFTLHDDEEKTHEKFLQKIKNANWLKKGI